MSPEIPLRIAEVTDMRSRMLRRYTYGGTLDDKKCPGRLSSSGHDASVEIEVVPVAESTDVSSNNWPHDDPRWPTTCSYCDYVFENADRWQRSDNRIVQCDGHKFVFWGSFGRCAPPGAMIRADWFDEYSHHPQGIESWTISLPDGGEWTTSQQASGGGYWEVTGTPPNITANPSIWHNSPTGWHGFVRDGKLVSA